VNTDEKFVPTERRDIGELGRSITVFICFKCGASLKDRLPLYELQLLKNSFLLNTKMQAGEVEIVYGEKELVAFAIALCDDCGYKLGGR